MTENETLREDIVAILYENEGDLDAQATAIIQLLINEGFIVPDESEGFEDDFEDDNGGDEW
jgi:hypothetical protein